MTKLSKAQTEALTKMINRQNNGWKVVHAIANASTIKSLIAKGLITFDARTGITVTPAGYEAVGMSAPVQADETEVIEVETTVTLSDLGELKAGMLLSASDGKWHRVMTVTAREAVRELVELGYAESKTHKSNASYRITDAGRECVNNHYKPYNDIVHSNAEPEVIEVEETQVEEFETALDEFQHIASNTEGKSGVSQGTSNGYEFIIWIDNGDDAPQADSPLIQTQVDTDDDTYEGMYKFTMSLPFEPEVTDVPAPVLTDAQVRDVVITDRPCENCYGTGVIENPSTGWVKHCPECDGTGIYTPDGNDESDAGQDAECSICEGRGVTIDPYEHCYACDGTGVRYVNGPKADAVNVEALKANWSNDPCWDIEETEGFEAHHDELLAYRLDREAEWKNAEFDRQLDRANALKIDVHVLKVIEQLEARIRQLENTIEQLQQA